MKKSHWGALALMASFAAFFVGGMHLRFRPITLVLVWFAAVLGVAWVWTRFSERRARGKWFAELDDPSSGIYGEASREAMVRALDCWEDARFGERKLFDELLARRRDLFLATARAAVESLRSGTGPAVPSTFLTRILEAYRDDVPFTVAFLEELDGEYRAEVWRAVASAAEEALEGNADAVERAARAWNALPVSTPARQDLGVAASLERWAEAAGLRFSVESDTH